MTQDEARKTGAMALFGEKYGEQVRVVSVGDWARELCGGTHTQSTGQLGVVSFLSESSIGAGVRRVEALVGTDAYKFLAREHHLVGQLAELVKVRPEELPDRIGNVLERLKEAERTIAKAKSAALTEKLADLIGEPQTLDSLNLYRFVAPAGTEAGQLRDLVSSAKGLVKTTNNVIIGAVVSEDKVSVVTTVDSNAKAAGISSADVLNSMMPILGGRGGGNADMAQGGGTNLTGLDQALNAAMEVLRDRTR
jgi:alanyl-tRNA synthetase